MPPTIHCAWANVQYVPQARRSKTDRLYDIEGVLAPGDGAGREATRRQLRGARATARRERVVDLHEPRTLDAVSRYVLHERPVEAVSPFVVPRRRRRQDPL